MAKNSSTRNQGKVPTEVAPTASEVQLEKLDNFDNWLVKWGQADANTRQSMSLEGQILSLERRVEFKSLIVVNPALALERAVSRVVRQDLPPEILATLETPVSATGDYHVYQGRPAPGQPIPATGLTLRYFETNGLSLKAHVFGEMLPVPSRDALPLRGVAVDREFAVAENAVRSLEIGEKIPAGTEVAALCPVSGKTTETVASGSPVTETTPTVELAGNLIALCNGSHVSVLEAKHRVLLQASGFGGAASFMDAYPGTSSRAIGNLRCLYLRVTYPDQMAAPNTEEGAYNDLRNVARFYLENSYGKLTTTSTVTPLLTLPHSMAWYIAKDAEVDGLGMVHSHARAEAKRMGYDAAQYDCIIVRVNGGPRLSGISWGGGTSVWVTWDGMDVMNHECGHSLGINHANFWNTSDGTAYGNGANQEYGNPYDVMGGGTGFGAHYNTITKRMLGWLPDGAVTRASNNGVFRIYAYDQQRLEEGKRYALTVTKDAIRSYNVEYHPAMSNYANSATLLYSGMGSNAGHLLDTTPGSPAGKADAGIQVGRTFSDWEADIHFTVLAKNATVPPSLDVAYFRGPFLGNAAPTATLTASATTVNVGGSITFTAAATDANGDTLAYFWDFNDGTSADNLPAVTRSFNTAGLVTAMVTVSDGKGGVARKHSVISVGTHSQQTVTGTVFAGSQALVGARVASGTKYAFTDSGGNYALAGVTTGSQSLTATLAGYTLTPQFTNPLVVVAGANPANWLAASVTTVTLTKTADAVEGGSAGMFTFTRTGDSTAALPVRISPFSGTAVRATDYTCSPDATADSYYFKFTIPAGQSSLAVSINPINDTQQEGPETIEMQLASNGGYLSRSGNLVSMSLQDDDTTLPQVSVVATDGIATEAPGDTASFTFTRSGATTAALAVPVSWNGTATAGADYASPPNVVTIPIGETSVLVTVNPINDSEAEIPETIIASLSANANFVRNTAQSMASATLSDDDTPYVSVAVPDNLASEADGDSGVFLITRTGDISTSLLVYYGVHGTALHGTDYAFLSGEVTIPAGSATAPVIVTPWNDTLGETKLETVILQLTTFNNSYSLGAANSGTVNIQDNDDTPVVSVRSGPLASEGGSNGSLIFRATGSGGGSITVIYSISGTATPTADYTALTGTVTIPATGISDVTVPIIVANDTLPEGTESIIATILPGASYRIFNDGTAQTTIRDNDNAERIMVSKYHDVPDESSNTGRFYLSRQGSVGNLTVNYSLSGSATNGVDYNLLTGSVVIPDGLPGIEIPVVPIDDGLVEGGETVVLKVAPSTGYGADTPDFTSIYLADNEVPSLTVGFTTATQATTELPGANGEFRDLNVVLSASSSSPVIVEFGSGGGSATGDEVDWALVDPNNGNAVIPYGTLVFDPGVTSKLIRVRILNDGIGERQEIASVELKNPQGASLRTGLALHTILIADASVQGVVTEERWDTTAVFTNQTWNDTVPNYSGFLPTLTTEQNLKDGYSRRIIGKIYPPVSGIYKFYVAADDQARLYLSTTSNAANKVQVATLTTASGYQSWGQFASQASAQISLVAGQSYYLEAQQMDVAGNDHLSVGWSGPGIPRQAIPTFIPDTLPRTMRLATAASTRSENDSSDPMLMVMLDRPAGPEPISVTYTTLGTAEAGLDYTGGNGVITFSQGEQMKLLPLAFLPDTEAEAPEILTVTLTNATGAQLLNPSVQNITLLDANAPSIPTQYFTAATSMAAGTMIGSMTASRTITNWIIIGGNAAGAFTVNGSGQITLVQPSALPNPGHIQLLFRATDGLGSSADGAANVICNTTQNVIDQRWAGITAYTTDAWSSPPSYSGGLASLTTLQNVGDIFSRRLIGYVRAPASGLYNFWLAGDDSCRLLLSTDMTAANKVQICSVTGSTLYQAWDQQVSQKSGDVALEAGQIYYLEVQQQENSGADHASVAWAGPGMARQVMAATAMVPAVLGANYAVTQSAPSIALVSPTNNQNLPTGTALNLTAQVVGGSYTISSVDFYDGTTLLGSDATAPYSITWNVTTGTHLFTARAVYAGGSMNSRGVNVVGSFDAAGDTDSDGFTNALEVSLLVDPYSASSQPNAEFAGLKAWWKLDETAGTSVTDASGLVTDSNLAGSALWGTGLLGNALTFDGATASVLLGNAAALTGTTDLTIMAWVKGTSGTVIQQQGPNAGENLGGYKLKINANGTVNFCLFNTAIQFNITSTATVNDGQWHQLAAVRAGTEGRLYVDGVLVAAGSGAVQPLASLPVVLGKDFRNGNDFLTGTVDDVRLYTRAISGAELDALHDAVIPNRAPIFLTNPLPSASIAEKLAYNGNLSLQARDLDLGDVLSFSKTSGPAWLTVAANGSLAGTPGNADVGVSVFVFQVSDNAGLAASASLTITVTNVNDSPNFTGDPYNFAATEDVAFGGNLTATDIDAGDVLTYSKVSGPAWLSISPTGTLSGTPDNSAVGNAALVVRVTDATGATDEANLTISVANVNDAPAFGQASYALNAVEDTAFNGQVSATDVDAGDALTFSKQSGPTWLTVGTNGILSGTPGNGNVGVNAFVVKVTDRQGTFVTAAVKVSVSNVNDAPNFTSASISTPNALQDTAYSGNSLASLASDQDQGDTLSFTKISGPAWLTVASNGSLSGTPLAANVGANTWSVRASDATGATASATLTITVLAALPSPWLTMDLGTTGLAGRASFSAGSYTLTGAGILGGTDDAQRFAYQTLSGDGSIVARVSTLGSVGTTGARIGVQIRETLTTNSKSLTLAVTGGGAYKWTRRTTVGTAATNTNGGTDTAPNIWLRLQRSGTTVTASKSINGTTWTSIGSVSVTMATNCFIGLVVDSGTTTDLNTSTFDNLTVIP